MLVAREPSFAKYCPSREKSSRRLEFCQSTGGQTGREWGWERISFFLLFRGKEGKREALLTRECRIYMLNTDPTPKRFQPLKKHKRNLCYINN